MPQENSKVVFRALSLGAGVQSSVLALLLSRGDKRLTDAGYSKPDVAIFADTGWEPKYVYQHLDWLEGEMDFPLIRVDNGNLKTNLAQAITPSGNSFVDVPLFTIDEGGNKGMLRRQCTNQYKLIPIYRRLRTLAGGERGRPFPKGTHAEMWIGISLDEVARMKPSRERWIENRWPLIDIGMSRHSCKKWFYDRYPNRHLPRSACIICPYQNRADWREMKKHEPDSYAEAIAFDKWMRDSKDNPIQKMLGENLWLHSSCRPIEDVITDDEQRERDEPDLFTNECEGYCGV